jgi:uncharacterized protein (DUF3820 family)
LGCARNPTEAAAVVPIKDLLFTGNYLSPIKIIYLDLTMDNATGKEALIALAHYKMPFGKYKGRYLFLLPEAYLQWFHQKGFPDGPLGSFMQQALEVKINGLESLLIRIQKDFPKDRP